MGLGGTENEIKSPGLFSTTYETDLSYSGLA